MRTHAKFAPLVLALTLVLPAAAVAAPGAGLQTGRNFSAVPLILACSRSDCTAFCSDQRGSKHTACMNTCLKRKENCN